MRSDIDEITESFYNHKITQISTRNFSGIGVDGSLIWGDYYFIEAIMKKYGEQRDGI